MPNKNVGWPSLKKRKVQNKLFVEEDPLLVPSSLFHRHPRHCSSHNNSVALPLSEHTVISLLFVIEVADHWNTSPDGLVSLKSEMAEGFI